jgi:hypothetical protein
MMTHTDIEEYIAVATVAELRALVKLCHAALVKHRQEADDALDEVVPRARRSRRPGQPEAPAVPPELSELHQSF